MITRLIYTLIISSLMLTGCNKDDDFTSSSSSSQIKSGTYYGILNASILSVKDTVVIEIKTNITSVKINYLNLFEEPESFTIYGTLNKGKDTLNLTPCENCFDYRDILPDSYFIMHLGKLNGIIHTSKDNFLFTYRHD